MKKIFLAACLTLLFAACADKKTIDGKTYRPYGIFNETQYKNDSIEYEVSGWAVFSGVAFSELLLIPTIYTFGYHLWEPVGKKSAVNDLDKGVISK